MRLSAIGLCAAIILGACSRNSGAYEHYTYTPPPPAPMSRPPATRHVSLRLQTLKGRTVTTGIDVPPALAVGAKEPILEAKALWRVPAAPTPPPSEYVSPNLTVTDGSLFVSTGIGIERIGMRSGHVLWRSTAAAAPFTVSAPLIAAAHTNTVTALSERDGRVRWRRAVCPVTTRVAAVAVDGQSIFALCANPAKLVALRAQSGSVLYTRILTDSGRGTSLQLLGSATLLADGFFNGARMSDTLYFVREHTGSVVLEHGDVELFRLRGSTADFIDRCCFEHNESYEPAKILPVNLLTGETGVETTLAPEPDRFKQDSGEGAYGPDGTLFSGPRFVYLYYGDTLFRYSRLDAKPVELLRGIDRVASAHADAFIAVLDGDPNPVLTRVDWTAEHPVLHPIAALESRAPGEGAITPMQVGMETLDGMPFLISASGAIARVPADCSLSMLAQYSDPHTVWALCTSASGTSYAEQLSLKPDSAPALR